MLFFLSQVKASGGREIFLSKCGACHQKDGDAQAFAPTKYASTQWKRFFDRNKHSRRKDISSFFNDEELDAVEKYLIKHAADSEQPEAVGLK